MTRIVLFLACFIPALAMAQPQRFGNLTIFSEDGDKFILVLNGEKQNLVPEANIRIEELPQPYYNARIIFEDQSMQPISRNNLMITDADGVFMDVTYKIRRDKSGKPKLNYFSAIEVQNNFVAPSGMYVHRFGESINMQGGVVTQTTTTRTNAASANINVPGISMNVTINEPDDVFSSSTTTTTTTTTAGGNVPPRGNVRGCNGWPMNSGDFNAARNSINSSAFDDTKLSTAKSILSSNCVSTDQIVSICESFSFEENKLEFAKFAYRYCTDPQNYFKVSNVFTFDSNKNALNQFISGQ